MAATNWTYTIFVDSTVDPSNANLGHAYIQITSPAGVSTTAGYYPNVTLPGTIGIPGSSGGHVLQGPGQVRNDALTGRTADGTPTQHPYDFATLPREVSPEVAQKMLNYIGQVTTSPGEYGVLGNNCVEFVEDLMIIAGDRSTLADVVPPFVLKGQLSLIDAMRDMLRNISPNATGAEGDPFTGMPWGGTAISDILGTTPDPLVKTIRYVDPLILDLDGDGLEITPLSRGVLFDANGDSIKTATAWAAADDGMLVWDRNGNGLIDSGRELFGDETILANGSKAANGFAALAELDSNANGKFDALDAQYANLRIWRDLNQDGISQTNELQTLQQSGVQSINLTSSAANTNYGDAILAQSGSFTRVDGAGVTSSGQAGSFILAQNNFVRQFVPITVSAEASTLPNIAGSGWVRDLQEARKLNMPTCRRTSQYQVDSCSRGVLSSWRS